MKRNVISILTASFLTFSLSYSQAQLSKTSTSQSKFGFFELKYEELLKTKNVPKLSDIASDVSYISLETNENCLIGVFARYYFCDSLIFVSNRNYILKFSSNGKFIKQIGKPGRGPGEINSIRVTSIIPNKRIIIIHDASLRKLMYFSFDGQLIKTVSVPSVPYIKVMNDGNYLIHDKSDGKSENYYFYVTKEGQDTLSYIKNYIKWTTNFNVPTTFLNPTFEPFYYSQDKYYAKTMYNDTIYVVNAKKMQPAYFIDLGKYKLPEENRAERLPYEQALNFRNLSSNYFWSNVFENGGKIFLTTYCFGEGSTYRILINTNGLSLNSNFDYEKGITMGTIANDWDGGPYFWPIGSVNNNQVFMPFDVLQMKKFIELMKSSNAPIKFKDKQNEMNNMIMNLDNASNPILMVVTFKL